MPSPFSLIFAMLDNRCIMPHSGDWPDTSGNRCGEAKKNVASWRSGTRAK
ncbi:predicted protein [Pyrenophora tritici-repentis Pt-1C-BFP]|uniref:Uncharacterized protein n=1 Tax=Pyrenophora tritici-repentis (strain Pt-1C-BFP) TaxID=426418 RepID=B2VW08_PYRTR|nr:uncharacterized protein PTRG_01370 [Pyrenophora tritici-repentis Pt-1C-BFP]EDU40808.1 predicted protein [Pyrenophora tritici-repentis Pt-1C-BFP]